MFNKIGCSNVNTKPECFTTISIAMETKNNNSIIKYLFAYLHLQK